VFAKTFGVLDGFEVSGNQLVAAGWIASTEGEQVSELRVKVGELATSSHFSGFLPSPDVFAAYPMIPTTKACRFLLGATLDDDALAGIVRREVISIVPYVNNLAGVPLERVWPPAVAVAAANDSERVGLGDFVETSFSFFTLFRLLGGLTRDEAVLDAGCGIGRMAFALAHYLSPAGRYFGFDVSSQFIEQARGRFRAMTNFEFRHADVFNKMYNPAGASRGVDFAFPCDDRSFSFAFLTSVFTHMLTDDVSNYLRELRRTLRRDGRCLATFFIIDEEADRLLKAAKSTVSFEHHLSDRCIVSNLDIPENAVAYREGHLRDLVREAGLEIYQLHRGSWPGRSGFLSYQDICLLRPSRQ
jgi:SAM-dependent methyltransferase